MVHSLCKQELFFLITFYVPVDKNHTFLLIFHDNNILTDAIYHSQLMNSGFFLFGFFGFYFLFF